MTPLVLSLLAAGGTCAAAPPPAPDAPSPPARQVAPPAPLSPDPDLDAELLEIDALAENVSDLTASFEQTKKSPLLKKPLVSRGTVKVKGSRVRWDTASPHATVMLVDATEVRIHYSEQRVLEVYELDDSLRRLIASPVPRLKSVREQFEIARATEQLDSGGQLLALDLAARAEDLSSHLSKLRVTLDRKSGLVTRVEMTDPDGEESAIAFTDATTNSGLNDRDFDLTLPEGTRVSKPLEGLSRPTPATPHKALGEGGK